MEEISPPPCPPTVTVRRNPPRKARATPTSAVPLRQPLVSPSLSRNIFSSELSLDLSSSKTTVDPSPRDVTENLKIYLRICPPLIQKSCKKMEESKNAWPKNPKSKSNLRPKPKKSSEICVQVNEDKCSVTVSTPQALQETKRIKSEVYGGFSRVFVSEAPQGDVFNEMVRPLAEDFLKGKSGMLAAMGPSGSGKTHTVFGSARDPGMVPLALRHIFCAKGNIQTQSSRVFYLSMFEISSEKGKSERMIDLLHEGGDNISMQNSVMKGLQEAVVRDAQQAESLIALGMLKRATATTNSNSQSSRSQCIINIRCSLEDCDEGIGMEGKHATLTIIDLAGAEREKRTGNKGDRLHESNFINNTSMVFGLCLRALLEHQKNRNKLLQKHYKSSLLTRYMQDYLEGKKRMMLILTVKSGADDYLDTSFLLRQASPFTKIKFQTAEETVNLPCHKRPNQALPRADQLKKLKLRNGKTSSTNENYEKPKADNNWEYRITLGLAKAMLTVLKQYKKKIEGVENENDHLRDKLSTEKTRNLLLEDELHSEKMKVIDLKKELEELKTRCLCREEGSVDAFSLTIHAVTPSITQCEAAELQEVNLEVTSFSSSELEQKQSEKKSDPSFAELNRASPSCSDEVEEEPCNLLLEELSERGNNSPGVEEIDDVCTVNVQERKQEPSITDDAQDVEEHTCAAGVHSRIQDLSTSVGDAETKEAIQLTGSCQPSSHKSWRDAVDILGDPKCSDPEYECDIGSEDSEIQKHEKIKPIQFVESSEAYGSPEGKETIQLTSKCQPSSHKSLQDMKILGHPKSSDTEYESGNSSEDAEISKDEKMEPSLLVDSVADGGSSIVKDKIVSEEQIVSITHSHSVISSSESPGKDEMSANVDEDEQNNEEGKECQEPLVAIIMPPEEPPASSMSKKLPKHASRNNIQHPEKPKRRLLPASSLLLKDVSILDVKDEIEKPKGANRGAKRVPMNDIRNRTQGSLSLLNLLTSKLDR